MKIVITGSLGNIGRPLAEMLLKEGHAVVVISNDADKRARIEDLGAIAAIGSLDDVAFLKRTFAGADAVFCMIPPSYTQAEQLAYYRGLGQRYKDAILETGVQRVVHLSSYGAHLPAGTGFIAGSYHVEQLLNTVVGIQLTHVRPTSFYYNLAGFIEMIKSAGFMGAVYGGDDRLALVSPKDIAQAVAQELLNDQHVQSVRYVGSDDRSCTEIASVLGKAIGRPELKWLTISPENVREQLFSSGHPSEYVDKLVELGLAIHTGKLREDYDLHTPALGDVKLEEYAAEFARLFDSK